MVDSRREPTLSQLLVWSSAAVHLSVELSGSPAARSVCLLRSRDGRGFPLYVACNSSAICAVAQKQSQNNRLSFLSTLGVSKKPTSR